MYVTILLHNIDCLFYVARKGQNKSEQVVCKQVNNDTGKRTVILRGSSQIDFTLHVAGENFGRNWFVSSSLSANHELLDNPLPLRHAVTS